jgi:serine phosphatase RsbU (regulator of sigma subunit)
LKFDRRYLPAGAVGGDFFSVQKLSETKVGVFISDVMGHGVHAALVTAILRVLLEELYPLAHRPGEFLKALNGRLFQILKRVENCIFVTASYLVLDIDVQTVLLANASHPAPFLINRANRTVARLGPPRPNNSFSLGLLEDSTYEVFEQPVSPGSTLLLYTDGLSDIYGPAGKECREMDLHQIVEDLCLLQGDQLVDGIISRVREKAEAVTFQDDVCLISVDWKSLAY